MRHALPATGARPFPLKGGRRARLGLEIAVVLLVKFLLLYLIWAAWFAHPMSRDLDAPGVAAALLGTKHGPPDPEETRHEPGP